MDVPHATGICLSDWEDRNPLSVILSGQALDTCDRQGVYSYKHILWSGIP